jgi:hypothetical protein
MNSYLNGRTDKQKVITIKFFRKAKFLVGIIGTRKVICHKALI